MIVPEIIEDNEVLVRSIFKPLFLKKNKLTYSAFLPPSRPNKFDVSVLRHKYTDDDFCKQHSLNLNLGKEQNYVGVAVVKKLTITNVNTKKFKLDNGEIVSVFVKSTPNPNGLNLPMHADILYSHSLVDEEPKTTLRMMAKAIIASAKFLEDPAPNSRNWSGTPIKEAALLI